MFALSGNFRNQFAARRRILEPLAGKLEGFLSNVSFTGADVQLFVPAAVGEIHGKGVFFVSGDFDGDFLFCIVKGTEYNLIISNQHIVSPETPGNGIGCTVVFIHGHLQLGAFFDPDPGGFQPAVSAVNDCQVNLRLAVPVAGIISHGIANIAAAAGRLLRRTHIFGTDSDLCSGKRCTAVQRADVEALVVHDHDAHLLVGIGKGIADRHQARETG